MKQKVETNEQAFKNLLKNLDHVSMALLRERVLTICEHTAENCDPNGFVHPRLYIELNNKVQKHLGFNN